MATLITGVGVVGSQIARGLVERGETPVLMDIAPQHDALAEIVDLDRVTLVQGDILKPLAITDVIRRHDITRVAHTVANADLTLGAQRDPLSAIELNVMGTVNVLEAARVHNLDRVIVSSSNVVGQHLAGGEGQGRRADEEAFPRPVTFYAATKQAVENIGLNYARWHGVDFGAVRYGAVAGPWSGRGGGWPSQAFREAVTRAVQGEEAEVPAIDMEWVYSKDAATGTVLALFAPDLKSRVFNITMGVLCSAQEFADALIQVIPGARVRIAGPAAGPSPIPDTHLASQLALAREVLGYTPAFDLVAAVRDMVDWLSSRDDGNPSDAD